MNIAIIDSPMAAMQYDIALGKLLETYARERTPNVNFEQLLSTEQYELKRSITVELARNISRATDPAATSADTALPKGNKKGGKPRAVKFPKQSFR